MDNVFETLYHLNVNEHTESRDNLTYLSWAWAWAEVKAKYPEAQYEIVKFDGIPYVYDERTGYMVYTNVTIGGITHEMWLPVMDSKNKAMKAQPYTYSTKYGDKTVEAATMFDVNKTIMRCLVKNLAMFGLGLYIYAGEDLPELTQEEKAEQDELKKKITEKEAAVLDSTLNDEQKAWVFKTYGIKKLSDLTNEQYGKLMRTINERREHGA